MLNRDLTLPYNPMLLRLCERNILIRFWKKEKMLVTSILSFFHNIFNPSQNKFQFLSHFNIVVCKCFQLGWASHLPIVDNWLINWLIVLSHISF